METNIHHHFWKRSEWNHYYLAGQIRNHPLSQTRMVIPIHNELHANVEPLQPPTSARMARKVLQLINETPRRYTSLDASKRLGDALIDTEAEYIGEHLILQIPYLELSQEAIKRKVI